PAELWDPTTETWTTLASISGYRGYHSIAVLLPDGRILSAGGKSASAEIFSPPYLFKGVRPSILWVSRKIPYGKRFSVASPDAATISKVTLIRLSSVTHTFNQNQRINF